MTDNASYWTIKISKWFPLQLLAAALLLTILYLMVKASYADYSERTKLSELMVLGSVAKTRISEQYLNNHVKDNMDRLFENGWGSSDYLNFSYVSTRGEIILYSEEMGALITFTPTYGPEGVSWKCAGLPAKFMNSLCRVGQVYDDCYLKMLLGKITSECH